jgi:hypothetical protein
MRSSRHAAQRRLFRRLRLPAPLIGDCGRATSGFSAVSDRWASAPLARDGDAAYLSVVMPARMPNLGVSVLVVALLAILAAALWFAASAWVSISGPPIPAIGYVAMAFGIVFSLIIGFGLMWLVFYSSRHGYDEPHRADGEGQ